MVSTPVSYLQVSGFKYCHAGQVSTMVVCSFPQTFQENSRMYMKLGKDHFFPIGYSLVMLSFDAK
jgi:hypothetical protein